MGSLMGPLITLYQITDGTLDGTLVWIAARTQIGNLTEPNAIPLDGIYGGILDVTKGSTQMGHRMRHGMGHHMGHLVQHRMGHRVGHQTGHQLEQRMGHHMGYQKGQQRDHR